MASKTFKIEKLCSDISIMLTGATSVNTAHQVHVSVIDTNAHACVHACMCICMFTTLT